MREAYFDLDSDRRRAARRDSSAVVITVSEQPVQLEIFPEVRHVEAVDPRQAIGPGTRVSALYRVRYGDGRQVHQVYHDRHGWYCAEHGPRCAAVADAAGVANAR
jgi:hypothetical protein